MTLFRRLSLAGIVLLLLPLSAPVQAQSTWQHTFGTQIAELLRSPNRSLQDHGMRTLIEVADRETDDVRLQAAAKPLLDIYSTSSEASRRLTAVVALSKLDDPVSYTTLLVMAMDEPEDRVRKTILKAAAASRSIQQPTVAQAYNRLLQQTTDSETHS